ncbi:hypothetical protein NKI95_22480 [Mesorhizobium sp. M0306]|uniref:hypothetical protein n=1 Tax=unclassified Mesorhizobium TaxID=325217 RepID=UPI003336FAE0
MRDSWIGNELIRVLLESDSVDLKFIDVTVELWTLFKVAHDGGAGVWINPDNRNGDVSTIWSLVGTRLVEVALEDTVRIRFDNGSEIMVPPGNRRGAVITGVDGYDPF